MVLKELKIPVGKLFLVRLNNKYIRGVELDIHQLFTKEDFTKQVLDISDSVAVEMKTAHDFMSQEKNLTVLANASLVEEALTAQLFRIPIRMFRNIVFTIFLVSDNQRKIRRTG